MLRSVLSVAFRAAIPLIVALISLAPASLRAQGVTTSTMIGFVTDTSGTPLPEAIVTATHLPTNTSYRAYPRSSGAYTIVNMRVGGPYRVTATMVGYQPKTQDNIMLVLGQPLQTDFRLTRQVVQVAGIQVIGEEDQLLNGGRTGAATFVTPEQVNAMPSIKRSTRDLTRLDPRSDGNFSFGGRNWLYNNISLDGSYFNNPFGLDDPAPGGQANAEPVPYDAVEQVQVSVAPFDVRQGGFTGANVNTVTRSGTNQLRGTIYSFLRNESFQGNEVGGSPVAANPSLSYIQSGFGLGGPIMQNKLFFYFNFEIERTDDPGSNFVACTTTCGAASQPLGVSRVARSTMDSIRQRMQTEYNYDTGPYEGYINQTDNSKFIARLDFNLNANDNLMLRYNFLDASRDLPPHPFVLSFNNTGRGPNQSSLPFRNSGYQMNNNLNSFALELNMRRTRWSNRLFASYNRFRDHRAPFSEAFPTIEIGEGGVTYTTVGHEPFSIHNILSQDVIQVTDNVSLFRGNHTFDIGINYESFSFFNSFNIFRNGVFFLPYGLFPGTSTFGSVGQFFTETDPGNANQANFRSFNGSGPYKGEDVSVGQLSFYLQDNVLLSPRFNLTLGVRADMPMYNTDPVDNPFSRGLTALDENGNAEVVDQSRMPSSAALFSPRVGFNWNASGDRRTQVRGGTGVFTGRIPFVWAGNVYSNPGNNPNLYPNVPGQIATGSPGDSSILQTSFDVNAVVEDFKWPQIWTTDLAIDRQLPWNLLGTLEAIYSKDLHAVYMRNADLPAAVGTVAGVDGRPFYGGCVVASCPSNAAAPELNVDGGAGIYVLDNTSEGYSLNISAQLRRNFGPSTSLMLGYNYLDAKNSLKSTEIASVLWQNEPVAGDPNRPGSSFSEFGQRHRFVAGLTHSFNLLGRNTTQIGMYVEVAEGNAFTASGGNRYSFLYSGDVNGDGYGGNDLIYIPATQADIALVTCATNCGANTTPAAQWAALDAFINQDGYLSTHRGQVAQRMGALNPWYQTVDLRILQDLHLGRSARQDATSPQARKANSHAIQFSLDVLNLGNLVNSSWGVRKTAAPSATAPLTLVGWTAAGQPQFNFTGPQSTYVDDPGLLSRWRIQLGLRYMFN